MNNIWFFGDSFVADDDNWVRFVADRCNSKIQHLGEGGASLDHTLTALHKFMGKIKSKDTVVITITDPFRLYLGGLHLLHQMLVPDEEFNMNIQNLNPYGYIENEYKRLGIATYEELQTAEWRKKILNVTTAFDGYINHLWDQEANRITGFAKANHIISHIIPNLNTKKVVWFYSIDGDLYEDSNFFHNTSNQPKAQSFWHTLIEYFAKHENRSFPSMNTNIMKRVQTPNHWIKSDHFENIFWGTYNPILKLIGADNPKHNIQKYNAI